MDFKAATGLAVACILVSLPGISHGQCGPGPHWIDQCPGGQDFFANAQATIGLDLLADGNLDGLVDMTYVLTGPATVSRSSSVDDSMSYPGTRFIDGHLDVIDTQIASMVLTGGGVTMIAGADQGVGPGIGLPPTLGNIAEQNPDNSLGDSFFEVWFELDLGGGTYAYNTVPATLDAVLDRVPIDATYLYTGQPLTLTGQLAPSGQLVTAELILPEPTTMALLALGAAPLALVRRRRRR